MRRSAIIVTCVAASVLIILLLDFPGARFAADRLKRVQELEAREAQLYERLAEQDAQRESQRQIYVDRIREGEARLREQAQEILSLRAQPAVNAARPGVPPTSRD